MEIVTCFHVSDVAHDFASVDPKLASEHFPVKLSKRLCKLKHDQTKKVSQIVTDQ